MNNQIEELTFIEHVLKRPDQHVGSIVLKEKIMDLASMKDDKISIFQKVIIISDVVEQSMIKEPLGNMADNWERTKNDKMPIGKMYINMSKSKLSFYNEGKGMDMYTKDGRLAPDIAFTKQFSGSNFNDEVERSTIGKNGVGIKCTCIYSLYVCVEVADSRSKKRYKRIYRDNMRISEDPILEDYNESTNYVKLTLEPDFKSLYREGEFKEFTVEMQSLMLKYIIDLSFVTKCPISFNGKEIHIKDMKSYAKLYFPLDHHIIWTSPNEEICITETQGMGRSILFVNGMIVNEGFNMNNWMEKISAIVKKPFLYTTDDKKTHSRITWSHIKPHLSFILNSKVDKPIFTGQNKNTLEGPKYKITIGDNNFSDILKWPFMSILKEINDKKRMDEAIPKASTRTFNKFNIERLVDAPELSSSGKKRKDLCKLIITEGNSARTSAISCIAQLPKDHSRYWGVYPVRGKFINVINAKPEDLAHNRELQDIINILGLDPSLDYTDNKNFSKLRYGGGVYIMADADDDGIHIRGLISLIFYYLFPSLGKRPFVYSIVSPLYRIIKGKQRYHFYTKQEAMDSKLGKPEHIKGLGTLEKGDTEILFQSGDPLCVEYTYDDGALDAIFLAFKKDRTEARKNWISSYNGNKQPFVPTIGPPDDKGDQYYMCKQTISDFINNDLIIYSLKSNQRCIPQMIDGLKDVQRRILYTALSTMTSKNDKKKVSVFAGTAISLTEYEHGDVSMIDSIVKMAHTYPGSNNLPLIDGSGQFGSIIENGEDASQPRYLYITIPKYLRLIFREQDDHVLDYKKSSNIPIMYCPIIPMSLINPQAGIGTAYSTSIPGHNPKDIIRYIKGLIMYKKTLDERYVAGLKPLIPWYKGWNGKIYINKKGQIVSEGIIDNISETRYTCKVRCLPVGVSVKAYEEKLKKLIEDRVIGGYDVLMKNNEYGELIPDITIKDISKPTLKKLHLKGKISNTNITLFDENRRIKSYSVIDIICEFFRYRYNVYVKRKEYVLGIMTEKVKAYREKARFLQDVIDHVIDPRVDENILHAAMEKRGHSLDHLSKTSLKGVTHQSVNAYVKKMKDEEQLMENYQRTDVLDIWMKEIEELEAIIY